VEHQFRSKAGFTGTRHGLSAPQRANLMRFLSGESPSELHHGDCTGADVEVHMFCVALGIPVHIHPPEDEKYRAFCIFQTGSIECTIYEPKPFLERDWNIVSKSGYLIACPKQDREPPDRRGSGTWTTVGYAREQHKPVVLLYPDGRVDNPLHGW
jgi:hypothetical protein